MSRIIVPSRKLWTPPHRQRGYVVLDAYRGGGEAWVTAVSLSQTASSTGWAGYTLRSVIPAANLLAGSKLRLTFRGATSGEALAVSAAYIGVQAAAGDSYDFGATPVQVLVGGSSGFSVPRGSLVVSDEIPLPIDAAKNLVFAAACTSGDMGTHAKFNWKKYEKAGADASTVDASGYGMRIDDSSYLIAKIEVLQP